jgi:large subunit ribosomal protein L30
MSTAKKSLKVVQHKSLIGQDDTMRKTILGLGLRGPGTSVKLNNTPSFRGAVKKVLHLVSVEEVDG